MLVSVVLGPVALCVLIFGEKKTLSVVVLLPAAVVAYLNKSNSSNVEVLSLWCISFFLLFSFV